MHHDDWTIERITAADDARLTCLRLQNHGPPVILVHGLAVNARIWLVPDVHGDDGELRFRSLARLLHDRGFDVWLLNLRGHGAPDSLSRPPPGQDDWRVDHFAAGDVPAVIDAVHALRGAPPWMIGASMGAMSITAALLGAVFDHDDDGREVIRLDDAARDARQAAVRGCVLIEFPAALRWPASMYEEDGRIRWQVLMREWRLVDAERNFAFEALSNAAWLRTLIRAAGAVDLKWLRPAEPARRQGRLAALHDWWDRRLERFGAGLARWYKGAAHFEARTFTHGLRTAVDHMKSGVLDQLALCVRERGFVSGCAARVRYSNHYDRIHVPLLVALGGRDRIANAEVTRADFFETVSSADKRMAIFDDLSHGEFEYAPAAFEQLYPLVLEWITR